MSEAIMEASRPKVREPFVVDNDMKAEWCLKKIRKVQQDAESEIAELQRQMEFYANEIEMIRQDADEDVEFFKGILRNYFSSRVDEGFAKASKTQTVYKLPSGKLIQKKQEPIFDYKDRQDDVIKFLEDGNNEQFIKVKKELKWSDFKKTLPKDEQGNIKTITTEDGIRLVTSDGEIVPGISVTMRDDKFEVEV